jgi:hypothetical protein
MFDASQLFLAAEICSQPFSREGYTMDRLLSRNFIGRLRRVRNQGRILTCSFKEQARRWNVYFSDYLALAEKWEDTGEEYDEFGQVLSSKKSNPRKDLERVMATAAFLVSETHWPEEHVMMMPLGKTYSWSDYFAIQKGAKFSFKTQAEQEAIERDKARIAREREEQAVQRN